MMRPAGRWCCTSGLGQAEAWRESIDWGVLDISGAYRRAFDVALPHVVRLANNSIDEVRRLGRTLARWHTPIVNWHHARVSNGPTEAINNLIKRVKRAAFGFRRFTHYRIRALLYAGQPNWTLLNGLTPR